jgi:hypothetical protein
MAFLMGTGKRLVKDRMRLNQFEHEEAKKRRFIFFVSSLLRVENASFDLERLVGFDRFVFKWRMLKDTKLRSAKTK